MTDIREIPAEDETSGFAALAGRIKELPGGAWRDTSRAEEAKAEALARERDGTAQGKPRRRHFDDGAVAAAQAKKRINVGGAVISFGLFVLALLFVVGAVSDKNSGPTANHSGTPSRLPITATVAVPADPYYELKPPVGNEIFLTLEQFRYCKFNKVRLDAMDPKVSNWYAAKQFRELIEDHNSRCAKFRYRKEDLSTINSDLAARSAELNKQGSDIVDKWNETYASWVPLRANATTTVFYRPDSLKKMIGMEDVRRVYLIWRDPEHTKTASGKTYASVKILRYFDCTKRTSGDGEYRYFDGPKGDGKEVFVIPEIPTNKVKFSPLNPGSIGEAHLNFFCSL